METAQGLVTTQAEDETPAERRKWPQTHGIPSVRIADHRPTSPQPPGSMRTLAWAWLTLLLPSLWLGVAAAAPRGSMKGFVVGPTLSLMFVR